MRHQHRGAMDSIDADSKAASKPSQAKQAISIKRRTESIQGMERCIGPKAPPQSKWAVEISRANRVGPCIINKKLGSTVACFARCPFACLVSSHHGAVCVCVCGGR